MDPECRMVHGGHHLSLDRGLLFLLPTRVLPDLRQLDWAWLGPPLLRRLQRPLHFSSLV